MCLTVYFNHKDVGKVTKASWREVYTDKNKKARKLCEEYLKVAKKDIIVYKVLKHEFRQYTGPYHKEQIYEIGHLYFQDDSQPPFGITVYRNHFNIHRGLHAYSTLAGAKAEKRCWSDSVLCKFMIPKGTKYFESGNKIACDQYVFVKVLKDRDVK